MMEEDGKEVRLGDWNSAEIETLNKFNVSAREELAMGAATFFSRPLRSLGDRGRRGIFGAPAFPRFSSPAAHHREARDLPRQPVGEGLHPEGQQVPAATGRL